MHKIDINSKESTAFLILFFIIWPFGAFIAALTHFRENRSKIIFILFAMLYGLTFMHRADSERVAQEFKSVSQLQGSEVFNYISDKTETTIDIFLPLTNILVSRVSSSANVLYMIYAFIYFMLVMYSFYALLQLNGKYKKLSLESSIFLILFLLYIRYSAINGVRFWIACFTFVYAIIQIIYNDKPKYLLLVLITPFIHFSYMFMFPVLGLYYLLRKNLLFCYALMIVSLIIPNFVASGFIENLGIFNETRSSRMEIYLYEGNVENRLAARAGTRWVIQYGAIIAQWTLAIAIFIPKFIFKIKLNERDKNMFAFLIVFLSLLQFTTTSFELHRRFFELFIVISIVFLYKLSLFKNTKFKPFAILVALLLTPQILFGLRASFETTNIGMFFSSLLTMPFFTESPVSIVDVFF